MMQHPDSSSLFRHCPSPRIHHVVPLARRRNFRLEPGVRIGLRLPALFLLGKSVALVLSKAAYNPANDNRWTWLGQKVLRDASSVPDAAVMWSVFISLAVSCLAEALVRALNNECVACGPIVACRSVLVADMHRTLNTVLDIIPRSTCSPSPTFFTSTARPSPDRS